MSYCIRQKRSRMETCSVIAWVPQVLILGPGISTNPDQSEAIPVLIDAMNKKPQVSFANLGHPSRLRLLDRTHFPP